MRRQFIVSSLSFCLLLHFATTAKEISQYMVDAEGHTIRFMRNKGQGIFIAVVNAMIDTCNLSATPNMPSYRFNEQTYWYHENRQADVGSYLTLYSTRDVGNDEALAQTLNCTATVAHNLLYSVPTAGISVDDVTWVQYLGFIPLAALVGGVVVFTCKPSEPASPV